MTEKHFVDAESIDVNGQAISWIGDCPWTGTLSYATHEGRFVVEETEQVAFFEKMPGESINHVAFSGDWLGASSTTRVAIARRGRKAGMELEPVHHPYMGGAHSLVGVSDGLFLAALGNDGLLLLDPKRNSARIASDNGSTPYFYKIVPLPTQSDRALFVCAGRADGLIVIEVGGGKLSAPVRCRHFEGHDIVDVSPLHHPDFPHAVACLCRSGDIIWIRDVFAADPPSQVHFSGVFGTAYTLIPAQGHLFLLTDRAFFCLPHAISRLIDHRPFECAFSFRTVEAADMFLVREGRSIALLTDPGAEIVDVAILVESSAGGQPCEPQSVWTRTNWHDTSVRLTLADAAPA